MSEPPIKCQTVYWHCITMDTTPLWPCALTRRPWLCLHLHVLRCDCCSSTNPLTGNESVWGHVGRYYSYLAKSGGSDNVEAHAMVKHTSLINTEFSWWRVYLCSVLLRTWKLSIDHVQTERPFIHCREMKKKKKHRQQAIIWPLILPFGPDLLNYLRIGPHGDIPDLYPPAMLGWYSIWYLYSHSKLLHCILAMARGKTPVLGPGLAVKRLWYVTRVNIWSIGAEFLNQKRVTVPSSVLGDRTTTTL